MKSPVLHEKLTTTLHTTHHYAHLSYLVLVCIESHGLYGIAAGVLGALMVTGSVINFLLGGD